MPTGAKQFVFDSEKIQQRLALLFLNRADHALARRLQEDVIKPNADRIIDKFYETLLFLPETRKWLLQGEVIEKLKVTQKDYLLSLGVGFDTAAYFENRLHIGVIHAAIALPLNTYLCAYSVLTQHIVNAFPESITGDPVQMMAMVKFLNRITSLDMSLAVEAYHSSNMSSLETTVEELHSRATLLQAKAEIDALTGVFNRDTVFRRLQELFADEDGPSDLFHIMMVDVDHFKKINDTYGHPAGDAALGEIAQTLAASLRDNDIIGRYGGEEFILALPDIDEEAAFVIAERIRRQVACTTIHANEHAIHVTVSIGLTSRHNSEPLEQLIQRADAALYRAKRNGRDCTVSD